MREKLRSRTLVIGLIWGLVDASLLIAMMFMFIAAMSVIDLSLLPIYAVLLLGASLLAGFFLADLGRVSRALQLSQIIAIIISFSVLSLTPSQVQFVLMQIFSTDPRRSSETGRLLFLYSSIATFSILVAVFGSIPSSFLGEWARDRRNARKLRPLDPLPPKE